MASTQNPTEHPVLQPTDPVVQRLISATMREINERTDPCLAIIGRRGVGKSSLINSLRNVPPGHPDAAEVDADEVYTASQADNSAVYHYAGIVLKDIPGSDGNAVDVAMGDEYIAKFDLKSAVACLFVYNNVLDVQMLECASSLWSSGVLVYFVRNKIDEDCRNQVEDRRANTEMEALGKIRHKVFAQMMDKGFHQFANDERIFLVSSKYNRAVATTPPDFDFQRLKDAVCGNIKDDMVASQLRMIFEGNSKELAKARADQCRSWIPWFVLCAAGSGSIPIIGVSTIGDMGIVAQATNVFLKEFALQEAQMSPQWKAHFGERLSMKVLAFVAACIAITSSSSLAVDLLSYIPVGGIIVCVPLGAAVSACGAQYVLSNLVDKLQQVAEKAYAIMLKRVHNGENEFRALDDLIDSLFTVASPEGAPTEDAEPAPASCMLL